MGGRDKDDRITAEEGSATPIELARLAEEPAVPGKLIFCRLLPTNNPATALLATVGGVQKSLPGCSWFGGGGGVGGGWGSDGGELEGEAAKSAGDEEDDELHVDDHWTTTAVTSL